MKNIFFIFITCFFVRFLFAQESKQNSFTHYAILEGLLSNQIYSVVQDEDGYMWIAGTDGLQRFDGTRYKSFRTIGSDSLSLPGSTLAQLLYDKKKRLWLLFNDGTVGIFNTKKFTFTRTTIKLKKPDAFNGEIKRLLADENGNVFFLDQGHEIVTWNEKYNEFSYRYNFFKLQPDWRTTDFAQQTGTEKYWIGILGGGIAIFNVKTGQLSYRGNNVEKEPAVDAFEKDVFPIQMLFDKKGRLWFTYWETVFPYIYCFNTKTNTYNKYELLSQIGAYHEVYGFMEQQDETIWAKGFKVFAKFLEKEKKFQHVYNG